MKSDAAAKKDDWRLAVDERVIRKCEQHERDGERLVFRQRLRTYALTPRLHVTPEDWGAGYLKQPEEREASITLLDDLQQQSPQALLRDLYRPIHNLHWHRREPIEGTERAPLAALDEVRKTRMLTLIAPRVEPIVRTVIAFMYWRIGMMAERWEPMFADDAPRKRSFGY